MRAIIITNSGKRCFNSIVWLYIKIFETDFMTEQIIIQTGGVISLGSCNNPLLISFLKPEPSAIMAFWMEFRSPNYLRQCLSPQNLKYNSVLYVNIVPNTMLWCSSIIVKLVYERWLVPLYFDIPNSNSE